MEHHFCMDVLKRGLAEHAFPSAAVSVGRGDEIFVREVMGSRTEHPAPVAADLDTLYDLASLTKLVATTMVALKLLEEGKLLLTHTLARYFTEAELASAPKERRDVTLFQLMTHTSGLTPHMPLWRATAHPDEVIPAILASAPVCAPGEQVHYSCMGYILLGKILERMEGEALDVLAREKVFLPLGMERTTYRPLSTNVAATEYSDMRGGYVCGEVHDENAHYLGGVSGNAGVFAPLADMERFARTLALRGVTEGGRFLSERTFALAIRNFTPGLSECRGLGFQLKPPVPALSAMGDLMSEGSYGHTGFTGTSLYVDVQSGLWGVLLTNAIHLGRDKTAFFDVRRRFYNAMVADFSR